MAPLKNNSKEYFSCLYDTYAPALYGVTLKLIPEAQLANTILEKSFVKIWGEMNELTISDKRVFSLMLGIVLKECKVEVHFSKDALHHLFLK